MTEKEKHQLNDFKWSNATTLSNKGLIKITDASPKDLLPKGSKNKNKQWRYQLTQVGEEVAGKLIREMKVPHSVLGKPLEAHVPGVLSQIEVDESQIDFEGLEGVNDEKGVQVSNNNSHITFSYCRKCNSRNKNWYDNNTFWRWRRLRC